MKVILLKDVKGVGRRFEERQVSDGHAINFLIPQKLAVPAAGAAAGQIKNMKEGQEKHKEADEKKLEAEIEKIAGQELKVEEKANQKGHLFAALTAEKLSEILKGKNINIPSGHLTLKQPIKDLGSHEIAIKIGEKTAHFTLLLEAK